MTLKSDMAADLDDLVDLVGESATYNAGAGDVAMSILFDDEPPWGKARKSGGREALAVISKTDLATRPVYRATLVIDGTTWRVFKDHTRAAYIRENFHNWEVPITTDERGRHRRR